MIAKTEEFIRRNLARDRKTKNKRSRAGTLARKNSSAIDAGGALISPPGDFRLKSIRGAPANHVRFDSGPDDYRFTRNKFAGAPIFLLSWRRGECLGIISGQNGSGKTTFSKKTILKQVAPLWAGEIRWGTKGSGWGLLRAATRRFSTIGNEIIHGAEESSVAWSDRRRVGVRSWPSFFSEETTFLQARAPICSGRARRAGWRWPKLIYFGA